MAAFGLQRCDQHGSRGLRVSACVVAFLAVQLLLGLHVSLSAGGSCAKQRLMQNKRTAVHCTHVVCSAAVVLLWPVGYNSS
jgi:hypothetical protein